MQLMVLWVVSMACSAKWQFKDEHVHADNDERENTHARRVLRRTLLADLAQYDSTSDCFSRNRRDPRSKLLKNHLSCSTSTNKNT
jgi:hypothetical protein